MSLAVRVHPLSPRERIALVGTLAAAIAVRAVDMIWFHRYAPDQEWSVGLAQMSWGEMVRTTAADTNPPFYYALLKLWFMLTPDTLPWAQALSLVFAVGWMLVVFRLGRDLFSPAAGWVALASAAAAPYQIYWMHSARMHPLQPVFIGLIVLLTYHWLERPSRKTWWGLAAAWALAIQTNYMALVFGVVWGTAFILLEPMAWARRLRLAAAPLPGLALFAPWTMVVVQNVREGPMNHPFFQETVSPIYLYYHSLFGTMDPYQPPQEGVAFLVFMLLFAAAMVAGARAVGRRWSWWVVLLGTPTLPIAMAKRFEWTLAERHLLFCLPAFTAYWGAGIVELARWARARLVRRAAAPAAAPSRPAETPTPAASDGRGS